PFRWHVDPLDGTTNFAHGYPCFAVSIGLEESGELIAGVVYQPVSGELFTAVKGEGAYLNQKKIQVSPIEKLATSLLVTGFPSVKRSQNPTIHYYWDFGLHSWDTAAGVLLVREAGGTVTQFNGQPYRLGDRELLASNGRVHAEMQSVAASIAESAASGALLP